MSTLFHRFLLCVVLLLSAASIASADSITASFTVASPRLPPSGVAPWGTLTLVLTAAGAVDVDLSMSQGFVTELLGFNVSGNTSDLIATGIPFGWFQAKGCDQGDFGHFNTCLVDTSGH